MAAPTYQQSCAQMLEAVGATGIVMRATGGAIPEPSIAFSFNPGVFQKLHLKVIISCNS